MNLVIGAGMGGLAAAIRLAQRGERVCVLEARDRPGGLASGVDLDGSAWDGGPYILLDRPGLAWAFRSLGLDLDRELELLPLDEVYRVRRTDGPTVRLLADLDATAEAMEADFPGAGDRYRAFVRRMVRVHQRLQPLQTRARPRPWDLLRHGLLREAPFLLRGLGHHLRGAGLPPAVQDALGIWTHIAGQPLDLAPAPMALVPAIVHTVGAFTVRGGIRRIPERLAEVAREVGVQVRTGARVERIVHRHGRVTGALVDGELLPARRIVSNTGISTLTTLLHPPKTRLRRRLRRLPLQSPGVAAWLRLTEGSDAPFLQFWLPPHGMTRVLVHPGAVDGSRRGQARLVSPVDHGWAVRVGGQGQRAHLDQLLREPWWQEGLTGHRVVARRVPVDWGRQYHLHRDAMNPVMTAAFMRRGRIPHQGPVEGLFLAGASTHPGQWVSFCAISGILAADLALG